MDTTYSDCIGFYAQNLYLVEECQGLLGME